MGRIDSPAAGGADQAHRLRHIGLGDGPGQAHLRVRLAEPDHAFELTRCRGDSAIGSLDR